MQVPGFQGAASRRRFDRPMARRNGKHMRGGAEEHAAASAHELKTQRLSNVDLPPLPIIAVMPGSILSAEQDCR